MPRSERPRTARRRIDTHTQMPRPPYRALARAHAWTLHTHTLISIQHRISSYDPLFTKHLHINAHTSPQSHSRPRAHTRQTVMSGGDRMRTRMVTMLTLTSSMRCARTYWHTKRIVWCSPAHMHPTSHTHPPARTRAHSIHPPTHPHTHTPNHTRTHAHTNR